MARSQAMGARPSGRLELVPTQPTLGLMSDVRDVEL